MIKFFRSPGDKKGINKSRIIMDHKMLIFYVNFIVNISKVNAMSIVLNFCQISRPK